MFSPEGECLYIGKSTRLLDRIFGHWRRHWGFGGARKWLATGQDFAHDTDVPTAPEGATLRVWLTKELKYLEWEMIDRLKPKFNTYR